MVCEIVMTRALNIFGNFLARQTPFQISFLSDNWEFAIIATEEAEKGEVFQSTSGFNLRYTQQSC
jgi:hypothetical protein